MATLKELRQQCKDRGLKGSGLKKEELVKLLSGTSAMDADFVLQPMITYIGNKRKLVPWIMEIVRDIHKEIGNLKVLDGFAGSGVVSRALMPYCSELHSNDMEYYSYILLRCFLETPTLEQIGRIDRHFDIMLNLPSETGYIARLYSPENTAEPVAGERCFYTRENAVMIDTLMKYIKGVEPDIQHYLLGPLLIKASIHVNTAGVFRGFYKKDGIGHFGGVGENALERILAPIHIEKPIWSTSTCKSICHQSDINELILTLDEFDLIYLDPPYNEHPYGSNYFMLNLIAHGEEPVNCSKVSGIPKIWNKSVFNGRNSAHDSMVQLLGNCLKKARYVLLSYNDEGLVTNWDSIFETLDCTVTKFEKEYDTYHGSRNLEGRNKKVTEIVYLIKKLMK
jgi:adenine-specific DNA-methyltransferase